MQCLHPKNYFVYLLLSWSRVFIFIDSLNVNNFWYCLRVKIGLVSELVSLFSLLFFFVYASRLLLYTPCIHWNASLLPSVLLMILSNLLIKKGKEDVDSFILFFIMIFRCLKNQNIH